MKKLAFVLLMFGFAAPAMAANNVIDELLAGYKAEGAGPFNAATGKAKWTEKHKDADTGQEISCATCHHSDLTKAGSHNRTGKVIEPMAPSVNPERFTEARKIKKWFNRNCKGTWGRECTAQEKGDFLTYLKDL